MENNCLTITGIIKNKNKIEYKYETKGKWNEVLNLNENMFLEFETDINIEDVPESVAVIPFICNILPISWVFDLTIKVDVIDEEFYNCIPKLKDGYANMYPKIPMLGTLETKSIEKNKRSTNKSATLFSGGVDAFNTLFSHINEKPDLITIWGADIKLTDEDGWKNVEENNIEVASKYGLEHFFIKTNSRTFINYIYLCRYISKIVDGEWWHEFQHGIGILGLVAPIAYVKNYNKLYIASSFTEKLKGKYTSASDPTIDNHLRFCGYRIIHDGYEYDRQDKIHNICKYMDNQNEKDINLRVCWISSGGKNCCECEKCYRTILGILVERKDPKNFGFNFTEDVRIKMMKKLPKIAKYNPWQQYGGIQERLLENYSLEDTPKDLMWFRQLKMKDKKPKYLVIWEKIWAKCKGIKEKILGRV